MPKTIIRLSNAGGELAVAELNDEDATVEAIAAAVRSLTYNGMSVGDTITITEEDAS